MLRRNRGRMFKHQLLATAIFTFGILLITLGGSVAFFQSTSTSDEYNSIKVGNLELSYVEMPGEGYGDMLSLNGTYPMSDSEGMETQPYRFSIRNTGSVLADFKIKILNDEAILKIDCCEGIENLESEECQNKLLQPQFIKYQLDNEEPVLLGTKEVSNYTIYETKNMVAGSSEIHELRIWITENASNEVLGKHYHGKVVIESTQGGVDDSLASTILLNNEVVNIDEVNHPETKPTLTTTSQAANEKGLYVSYETNSGKPTYYFRGAVDNNWVRFADMDWRIVRINEDGSIRLILQNSIDNNKPYQIYNNISNSTTFLYYSNWPEEIYGTKSSAKKALNDWYKENIRDKTITDSSKKYGSYISESKDGGYFCEEPKAFFDSSCTSGLTNVNPQTYNTYTPDFKCKNVGTEPNVYGKLDIPIGLLMYDELVFAGGYYYTASNFYLHNNTLWWTMSPSGWDTTNNSSVLWVSTVSASVGAIGVADNRFALRPVINLKADTIISSGNGTESNKYTIKYTN